MRRPAAPDEAEVSHVTDLHAADAYHEGDTFLHSPAFRRCPRGQMKPLWKYCSNHYLPDGQCAVYRDDRLGVQLQVRTSDKAGVFTGRNRAYRFYIDGVDKAFSSEQSMLRALQKTRSARLHPLR